MIPEFGQLAIILAFCLGLVQATLPLWGAYKNNEPYMQLSRYTSIGQFFFIAFAFGALAYSFLVNDFSVAYVAENSNRHLPWVYRFCAVWGAHEGSLLLWVFILTLWMMAVALFSHGLPKEVVARVLAVMAMVAIGFYLFLLLTSDPFIRLLPNIPADGADLNPLLQDPGLVAHPPMLYMGYVGFSVAFAFSIAALLGGKMDGQWARWTRPWTQVAWCFLTVGIVLGSWWAYRELGWGGWWFWDPVENASFLPWLIGTALIHSLAVTEKRNVFKAWTVLLAVCAFSLSLLGTFLVRSGIIISVHAFAVDPARGLYMLRFLSIVVGASLLLYAWRGRHLVNTGKFDVCSRETLLLCNNVIFFVAMLTVLLGTLYPLILQELHMGIISVGPPYFNAVFIPLMIPALIGMGIGPLFHWQTMRIDRVSRPLLWVALLATLLSLILVGIVTHHIQGGVVLGLALALWVIINNLSLCHRKISRSQIAMMMTHVGFAVAVIGLVLTSYYTQQLNLSMRPGDMAEIENYHFQFRDMIKLPGPNYVAYRAAIDVTKRGRPLTVLYPELRYFQHDQTVVSKTAIDATLFRDIYVALGSSLGNGAFSVRVYYKPFVRWIWYGGLLMALGGFIAVFDRRYRRGTTK